MNTPNLFDRLRARLITRGADPAYVSRFVGELESHCEESRAALIQQGTPSLDSSDQALATLGSEADLFRAAVKTLRNDYWLSRHRVFSMIIFPWLIFPIVLSTLKVFLAMGVAHLFWDGHILHLPGLATASLWTVEAFANLVIPLGCLWLLARIGRACFCGRDFIASARIAVVLWTLIAELSVRLPTAIDPHVTVSLGGNFRFLSPGWPFSLWLSLYLPILILWMLAVRRRAAIPFTTATP